MNRTICIPVAEVITGGTKSEFYAALRVSLEASRAIANLSATECLRQDVAATTDKCSKLYTYPIVSCQLPGMSCVTANICRAVEKMYFRDRWQVRRGLRASRSYRSFPWPLLANKSTTMLRLRDAGEWLETDMRMSDGKWWTVRLAGGSAHRDQIRGLRAAIKTTGIGDSRIWTDRKHKAILGICVDRVPSTAIVTKSGVMEVASTIDHLLVCSLDREDTGFVLNGDEAKVWQAESNCRQQRLRQDRKADIDRRLCREKMNNLSNKMARRMKNHVHVISAQVVAYAVRRKVASVRLNLTVKSYIESYKWHALATAIKYKCEDAGVECIDATQTITEPDVNKPHVYFKYAPLTGRVKIGLTAKDDGSRHGSETDSSEELVILAIDPQPKTKLRKQERHYHAMFAIHRISADREWFTGLPVIEWLRAVGWLGNAGNLSQISQVLDVSQDMSRVWHLQPDRERCGDLGLPSSLAECRTSVRDIWTCASGLAVPEDI